MELGAGVGWVGGAFKGTTLHWFGGRGKKKKKKKKKLIKQNKTFY